jgi:IclR family acetate operon transcriptional repressor
MKNGQKESAVAHGMQPSAGEHGEVAEVAEVLVGEDSAGGANRSVARALKLLRDIATSAEPQSFSLLQKRHKLPKGTLHNLLSTLEAQDYIRRDAVTGRYRVGFTVMELAASNTADVGDLGTLLEPVLEKLVAESNETLHLGMLNGAEEFILRRIDPRAQIVRIAPQVGRRHPAHATSGGIASLALMDDATVDELLPPNLVKLTENTVDNKPALMARLKEVRAAGYNLDLEEAYIGVRCVAVAISAPGWPTISISFTLPLQRASLPHLRSLVLPLQGAAKKIHHMLSVTPHV